MNAKRKYVPKPGNPERAAQLLWALKEFWQRSDLEWPEIAKRLGSGSNQPTLWGWFNGTRSPCEMSLNRIERFLKRPDR